MLVRVALYVLATVGAYQAGVYLGKLSRPSVNEDVMGTLALRSRLHTNTQPPAPCPEHTDMQEVVMEEPCSLVWRREQGFPEDTSWHSRYRYGPGK